MNHAGHAVRPSLVSVLPGVLLLRHGDLPGNWMGARGPHGATEASHPSHYRLPRIQMLLESDEHVPDVGDAAEY